MRQFIAQEEPDSKGCLCIEGKNFRYFRSILRVSAGDMIDVRLPSGKLTSMTVASVDSEKKRLILQIAGDGNSFSENQSGKSSSDFPEFWLLQLIPMPARLELIIRQAVECGVNTVVPVHGEFCQKSALESARKKASQSERWERIITEARQQSGSPVETKVLEPLSLKEAVELFNKKTEGIADDEKTKAVLYERTDETKSIFSVTGRKKKIKAALLVSGAEGGISPSEIDFLKENGVAPVHFETNILRCETASLYGTAVLQTLILEKEKWQLNE